MHWKPKKLRDLLYCGICFIVIVTLSWWSGMEPAVSQRVASVTASGNLGMVFPRLLCFRVLV